MARAYLDHASPSPLRPAALDAMLPYLREHHADPGRLHAEGPRDARRAGRRTGAGRRVLRRPAARGRVHVVGHGVGEHGGLGRADAAPAGAGHVVTTAVEHSCVRDAIARTATDVTRRRRRRLGPLRRGRGRRRDPRPTRALVTVQLANHEVGTLQPARRGDRGRARSGASIVHVDACAAAGHVAVDFRALDADLCSVTAHKLGGPKGAGALLVRRGLRISIRCSSAARRNGRGAAGIENVPAWVGFGAACAAVDVAGEAAAQRALVARAAAVVEPRARRSRGSARRPDAALPNLLCLGVDGVEAEPILLALDQHGVAVHSGSSCSSETLEPSPVLAAMGVDADHSLRVSVGWSIDDRRRRPLRGSVPGNRRTTEGVASAMTATVRRLNHAVLYVRDARRSADVLQGGVRVRGASPSSATAPPSSCARPRPRTTTTSACSRSARKRPRPEQGRVGLYHLAWQVDTIQDLADDARAAPAAWVHSSARATTA